MIKKIIFILLYAVNIIYCGVGFDGINDKEQISIVTAVSRTYFIIARIYPVSYSKDIFGIYDSTTLLPDNCYIASNGSIVHSRWATNGVATQVIHISTQTIPLNKWAVVGVGWDGTNMQTYINGVWEIYPSTYNLSAAGATFRIGQTSGIGWYDGYIDTLFLYRIPLTQKKVMNLAGGRFNVLYDGVSGWRFLGDNYSGKKTNDMSKNKRYMNATGTFNTKNAPIRIHRHK